MIALDSRLCSTKRLFIYVRFVYCTVYIPKNFLYWTLKIYKSRTHFVHLKNQIQAVPFLFMQVSARLRYLIEANLEIITYSFPKVNKSDISIHVKKCQWNIRRRMCINHPFESELCMFNSINFQQTSSSLSTLIT